MDQQLHAYFQSCPFINDISAEVPLYLSKSSHYFSNERYHYDKYVSFYLSATQIVYIYKYGSTQVTLQHVNIQAKFTIQLYLL